jgi:uncharacterized membrane protein
MTIRLARLKFARWVRRREGMSTTSLALFPSTHDRITAGIAHAGAAFAWFLAPLLVFIVAGRDSRWARYQALQSLLWSLLGTLVSFVTFGLAIPVFLVWHIIAAIKTMGGSDYEYPWVGEVAHRLVYGDE